MQRAPGSAAMAWLLRAGVIVLLAAAVTGWLAVDRAAGSARSSVAAQDAALTAAIGHAESTSAMAAQLQASVDALAVSAGSIGETIGHTIEISQSLHTLLTAVGGLDNLGGQPAATLQPLSTSLDNIGAQLLENQGGLGETQAALTAAQPLISSAAAALQQIPDQLRTAQAGLDSTRSRADDAQTLWRVTIVLATLVMGLVLFALIQP